MILEHDLDTINICLAVKKNAHGTGWYKEQGWTGMLHQTRCLWDFKPHNQYLKRNSVQKN